MSQQTDGEMSTTETVEITKSKSTLSTFTIVRQNKNSTIAQKEKRIINLVKKRKKARMPKSSKVNKHRILLLLLITIVSCFDGHHCAASPPSNEDGDETGKRCNYNDDDHECIGHDNDSEKLSLLIIFFDINWYTPTCLHVHLHVHECTYKDSQTRNHAFCVQIFFLAHLILFYMCVF